jgi:hypothetical protein
MSRLAADLDALRTQMCQDVWATWTWLLLLIALPATTDELRAVVAAAIADRPRIERSVELLPVSEFLAQLGEKGRLRERYGAPSWAQIVALSAGDIDPRWEKFVRGDADVWRSQTNDELTS